MANCKNSIFRSLPCVVLLLTGLFCSGQTVTFRVITENGKPLEKRKVAISIGGFNNGKPLGQGQIQETDRNGEARFTLPSPSPRNFFFYVEIGSVYWHCRCDGIPRTQEIVQKGILESAADEDSKFKPQSGEVLIVARRFSLMERLFYPLMKG